MKQQKKKSKEGKGKKIDYVQIQTTPLQITKSKTKTNEHLQSVQSTGSTKLQRRSSLNLLGEAGTDFQISK
jgi:hypothetical protein